MITKNNLCIDSPAGDPEHWILDESVDFLNHGSFGACPRPVLEAQARYREEMEREPVRFMTVRRGPLQDEARQALCGFVGARFEDLVLVPNSTSAVSAVVRSLDFEPGDELLTTNHAYNACTNALRYVAQRCGAHLRVAEVPFPLTDAGQVVEAVMAALTDRTRLLYDHGIDVPVSAWPALPRQTLRISAQAYNHLGQFERLAEILKQQFTRTS